MPDRDIYVDEDVTRLYGLSTSQLRTAQRFGLVEASITQRSDGRYVRAWSTRSVARVYVAHLLATHLSLPYHIASIVLADVIDRYKSAADLVFSSESLGEITESVANIPRIGIVDRNILYVEDHERQHVIGVLTEDGRTEFMAGEASFPAEKLSTTDFNAGLAILRFFERKMRETGA